MIEILKTHGAVIAAFLSFLATAFAAYATWQGPRSAAAYAEQLRKLTEAESQKNYAKRFVFYSLMQERAATYTPEAVKVLNSIDVVFHDSRDVREAWSSLFTTFDSAHNIPLHIRNEKMTTLLRLMAAILE